MEYVLKANVVIILFYLCYKLFLQQETFFQSNRFFLLTGLFAACLIPLVVIPIYIESSPISSFEISTLPLSKNTETAKPFNYLILLKWSYLLGALFFLVKFLIQLTSLLNIILSNNKVTKGDFNYIEINKKHSPFSFFKYIVYNPNQFKANELNQIILHEKVHAKQYHSVDILLIKIATVLFWFNPFIWLYNKSLQQNLEFIADNETQRKISNTKSYQSLLLKTFLSNNQMAVANNFYNSLIKKRIIMLHKSKSNKLNGWKYALILPLLALFLMSFNTKEVYLKKSRHKTPLALENSKSSFEALITKNSKESQLDEIKELGLKQGVTLKINGVKRNSNNEITAIKIEAKSKQSSANYQISNDSPIESIRISFDNESGSISIGSSNTKAHTSVEQSDNVFFFSSNDENVDGNVEMVIKEKDGKKGKKYKVIKTTISNTDSEDKEESIYFIQKDSSIKWISNDESDIIIEVNDENDDIITIEKEKTEIHFDSSKPEPLYFLDGKEITKRKLNKIAPNEIKSVNVLKGDTAIGKYGPKAENGVIEITLKK